MEHGRVACVGMHMHIACCWRAPSYTSLEPPSLEMVCGTLLPAKCACMLHGELITTAAWSE